MASASASSTSTPRDFSRVVLILVHFVEGWATHHASSRAAQNFKAFCKLRFGVRTVRTVTLSRKDGSRPDRDEVLKHLREGSDRDTRLNLVYFSGLAGGDGEDYQWVSSKTSRAIKLNAYSIIRGISHMQTNALVFIDGFCPQDWPSSWHRQDYITTIIAPSQLGVSITGKVSSPSQFTRWFLDACSEADLAEPRALINLAPKDSRTNATRILNVNFNPGVSIGMQNSMSRSGQIRFCRFSLQIRARGLTPAFALPSILLASNSDREKAPITSRSLAANPVDRPHIPYESTRYVFVRFQASNLPCSEESELQEKIWHDRLFFDFEETVIPNQEAPHLQEFMMNWASSLVKEENDKGLSLLVVHFSSHGGAWRGKDGVRLVLSGNESSINSPSSTQGVTIHPGADPLDSNCIYFTGSGSPHEYLVRHLDVDSHLLLVFDCCQAGTALANNALADTANRANGPLLESLAACASNMDAAGGTANNIDSTYGARLAEKLKNMSKDRTILTVAQIHARTLQDNRILHTPCYLPSLSYAESIRIGPNYPNFYRIWKRHFSREIEHHRSQHGNDVYFLIFIDVLNTDPNRRYESFNIYKEKIFRRQTISKLHKSVAKSEKRTADNFSVRLDNFGIDRDDDSIVDLLKELDYIEDRVVILQLWYRSVHILL